MLRNLKIRTKLLLGYIVIIVMMSTLGLYIVSRLGELSVISREVGEAEEISVAALDFNVENFHTQLEVLEYAYEPSQKRRKAFEEHDKTLSQLLEYLLKIAKEEGIYQKEHTGESAGIIEGGIEQIEKIASDLERVRADWIGLFSAVGELEKAKEKGLGEGDEKYEALDQIARKLVIANENLFDEIGFNKKIDKLVLAQSKLVKKLEGEQMALISAFVKAVFIFIGVLLVSGIVIAMVLSTTLTRSIVKARDAAIEIARGNMDVEIVPESNDEIGELSEAIDKMRVSLKAVMEEYEKRGIQLSASDEKQPA